MIGTIDIRINAAKPNFPLSPFYAFINSPSQIRVVNVPKSIGDWEITAVYVTANYPDNTSQSVSCTLTGGCWHGTLPASTATGTSTNGFTITADGVKEDGTTAVTGYVLGKGDVSILDTDGTITVGSTTFYIHLLDEQPTTPHKGDLCVISGAWKIYTGSAWIGFGGGGGDVAHSDFTSVSAISDRYTMDDIKGKVNEVLTILKGSTAALALVLFCASAEMPTFADIATQTAQLGSLYNDSLVVTNVTGASTDPGVVSNIVESYGYTTTNQLNDVKAIVATWENFLDGSNVVFSITNYISGSYNLDAAKLRILELTNGVYHEVYNSRDEIALHMTDFRTNDLATATNEIATAFDAKIATKAPRAWGQYSSAGTDINSLGITNAVYLTAPTTYFAGGTEWWSTSVGQGTVCVLAAKGAASLAANEEGTFYFRDLTTTNYFGFSTRDNFVIGCDADRCHTEQSGQDTMMVIEYDLYNGASYPILLYRPTLENFASNSWVQLNDEQGEPVPGAPFDIDWTNDVDTYTAFVNCGTNAAGFFMAETMVNGEVEFSTNMKADLKGGILTTDGEHIIKPVYADGELTWRTFDYGSGIQVSTPSASQVNQVATQKASSALEYGMTWTATNFLDNSYADLVSTNYLDVWYYRDYQTGDINKFQVFITNDFVYFCGTLGDHSASIGRSKLVVNGTSDGENDYHPQIRFDDENGGNFIIHNLEDGTDSVCFSLQDALRNVRPSTTSRLVPDGSQVMTSNLTERAVKKLTGVTYDFQNGTNFTLRLYETLTNIIDRLGGSVINTPSFD